jgi:hypothetical protein
MHFLQSFQALAIQKVIKLTSIHSDFLNFIGACFIVMSNPVVFKETNLNLLSEIVGGIRYRLNQRKLGS